MEIDRKEIPRAGHQLNKILELTKRFTAITPKKIINFVPHP